MKILNSKKSTEVVSNWPFYIIFAVAIGFMVMIVVKTGNVSVAEASRIPPSLEDEVLLASRFYNLGECFAYVDEVGRVHSKTIDQEKFTKAILDSCYAPSNANYAFRLALEPLSVDSKYVPVPTDFDGTCDNICNKEGKVCMTGIDDGGAIRSCTGTFGFEENDDYCICGDTSEKAVPSLPANDKLCNDICTAAGKTCTLGIDDGDDIRRCEQDFDFEASPLDDYCICGSASGKMVPSLPANDKCNNVCAAAGKACMTGIDDGDDIKECDDSFGFEAGQTDDYCICRDKSEQTIPVPDNIPSATCNTLCSNSGKECVSGVNDGSGKQCADAFTFNSDDDYCICRGEITPLPFPSSTISTYNWISGKFENTKIEEKAMVVFNDNAYEGRLTIKIQNVQ